MHFTFCIYPCPANCRLSRVDRSAAGRVAPPRLLKDVILDYARNGRIASGILKHLFLPRLVILGVIFDERNPILVVMVHCLATVRAARFCIYD